jgi:hypothetical protein
LEEKQKPKEINKQDEDQKSQKKKMTKQEKTKRRRETSQRTLRAWSFDDKVGFEKLLTYNKKPLT